MKTGISKRRGPLVLMFVMFAMPFCAPAWAADFVVSCAGGGGTPTHPTVQSAVNAAPTDGPQTILISGNCAENVTVNGKNNLTIRKAGPAPAGSGITGVAGPGSGVLTVRRSDNFRLESLIVVGIPDSASPGHAILIDGFSDATIIGQDDLSLTNCIVQGARSMGISVSQASYATVRGCFVQNNGSGGISASQGTFLTVQNSNVRQNPGASGGINVGGLSSVTLCNSAVQDNTGGNGVSLGNGSVGTLAGDNCANQTPSAVEKNEISGNSGTGIFLGNDSVLTGVGGHLIHNNGGRGIQLGGSTIGIGGQTIGSVSYPLKVYGNGGQGVSLAGSTGSLNNVEITGNNTAAPLVFPIPPGSPFLPCGICLRNSSSLTTITNATVQSNVGDGIFLDMSSTAFAFFGLTITGNTRDGVHLESGGGIRFQYPFTVSGGTPPAPNNISGNAGFGLNCTDNISWAAGDTTGISKPIKCQVLN